MQISKYLATLLSVAALTLSTTGCEQVRLDAEVRRLCAIDGGVKVYEKVVLAADQFDATGLVKAFHVDEVRVAPGYALKFYDHYYKKGDVPRGHISSIVQSRVTLTRRSDGKLMGESVFYQRGGGQLFDLLGGAPSHFECPSISEAGDFALVKRVFVPAEAREKQ